MFAHFSNMLKITHFGQVSIPLRNKHNDFTLQIRSLHLFCLMNTAISLSEAMRWSVETKHEPRFWISRNAEALSERRWVRWKMTDLLIAPRLWLPKTSSWTFSFSTSSQMTSLGSPTSVSVSASTCSSTLTPKLAWTSRLRASSGNIDLIKKRHKHQSSSTEPAEEIVTPCLEQISLAFSSRANTSFFWFSSRVRINSGAVIQFINCNHKM